VSTDDQPQMLQVICPLFALRLQSAPHSR